MIRGVAPAMILSSPSLLLWYLLNSTHSPLILAPIPPPLFPPLNSPLPCVLNGGGVDVIRGVAPAMILSSLSLLLWYLLRPPHSPLILAPIPPPLFPPLNSSLPCVLYGGGVDVIRGVAPAMILSSLSLLLWYLLNSPHSSSSLPPTSPSISPLNSPLPCVLYGGGVDVMRGVAPAMILSSLSLLLWYLLRSPHSSLSLPPIPPSIPP